MAHTTPAGQGRHRGDGKSGGPLGMIFQSVAGLMSGVVSAPGVTVPVAVRYGFEQFVDPIGNLYNREGLPPSPFRTDDWSMK
jgi:hypothetical protein